MKLSVIMACHNRRELTIQSIKSAQSAAAFAGADISFTLFDDGSTDGTSAAVSGLHIPVRILTGDGFAYWARGMALAEATVIEDLSERNDEFIVWLNDDVILDQDVFSSLSNTIESFPDAVIVGAMRDPNTGETTYSGMRKAGLHPLRFDMVAPSAMPQNIEVFNGNLVVVPIAIARAIGGIDGGFSHALADIDYGLRCGRAEVPVFLAPSTYGTCTRNVPSQPGRIRDDWATFVGAKGGGNYSSLRRILRKSHPLSWPIVIAATYSLWWARRLSILLRRG